MIRDGEAGIEVEVWGRAGHLGQLGVLQRTLGGEGILTCVVPVQQV